MAFAPTARAMAPDGEPDVTATPFTVTVAAALETVGAILIDVVVYETDAE